jgi:hypothetical protein
MAGNGQSYDSPAAVDGENDAIHRRRSLKLQELAALLSILAVWSYGSLYLFYWSFYGKFGISVLEIGLSQTEMIARALAGVAFIGSLFLIFLLLPFVGFLLWGVIAAIQYLSERWPRWQWLSQWRLPSVRLVLMVQLRLIS